MTTSETIPIGVVVERRKLNNPWQEWAWRAIAVFPGAPEITTWKELKASEDLTQFHAATVKLELHRKETEGYIYNLQSPAPAIFIVMRENEGESDPAYPVGVHLVTASAFEAQDYMDSGEETVEAVAMPEGVREWIVQFIETHHQEETFIKRKRDKVKVEDHKFGKEPIFDQGGRVAETGDER